MCRITVVKRFRFEAAHRLPDYNGPCRNLHGHTYVLQVGLRGVVGKDGFVVDFKEIKALVKPLLEVLDHSFLNEVDLEPHGYAFPSDNPTAERMVQWFVDVIAKELAVRNLPLNVELVKLNETEDSYAEWRATKEQQ